MKQLDDLFFETYKHLDKTCGEIFNCNNGISTYISEMENNIQGQHKIESWISDYKSLKHIRWIRNKIAHESTDILYCEKKDIEFIENFNKRIIEQTDPLSLLSKLKQTKNPGDKKSYILIFNKLLLIIVSLLILVLLIVIYYFVVPYILN